MQPRSDASRVLETSGASATPLRLAYFTNRYPAVSHTFIRRELLELERRGHSIARVAIRRAESEPVDPADRAEQQLTFHLLEQPRPALLLLALRGLFAAPIGAVRALLLALELARHSDRGFARHLAYWAEALVLRARFKRLDVEHVHVHFGTNPACVALLLRVMGGPRYSFTVHGPDEFDAPSALALAEKIAGAQFVIGISHFAAAQLQRWARPADWNKIHVVRCTVGEDFLRAEAPRVAGEGFVCVGRLSAQKGHFVLVDALRLLGERGVRPRMVLAGDGELRAELEREIHAAGLDDQVEITGWIDEAQIRARIRAARALVLASFAEGLPMVLMEALAVGRPVIATRVAAIGELVENERSGWLVTSGRADLLADAMEACLAASPEQLAAMAAHGKRAVAERHNTRVEGERLEALLLAARRDS